MVKVMQTNGQESSLFFVLDANQNLSEQVEQKLGADVKIIDIVILGRNWP
jgi:hypothetical protein